MQKGFTIVELLIVIVIIGILATIVIVAYNGITARAHTSTLQSDLNNASRLLEMAKVSNMNYPDDLSTVKNGAPLTASKDNKFAYNVSSDKSSYCLAASYPATNPTITLVVTEKSGVPVTGDCSGAIAIPPCTTDTYAIGATGPGGGKVFYDKGGCSNGWRYMEYGSVGSINSYPYPYWCLIGSESNTLIGTGAGIGDGLANTIKIATMCDIALTDIDPFKAVGGVDGWFLPSRDELYLISDYRDTAGLCGGDNWYLSSSEVDASHVYYIDTSPGVPYGHCRHGDSTYLKPHGVFDYPGILAARRF